MARYPFLTLVILFEILKTVTCVSGNESFNPFSPRLKKKSEIGSTNLLNSEGFLVGSNEAPSEQKVIEKRRLFLNEGEGNFQVPEREHQNFEYSARKRTNYSESETENLTESIDQKEYNNWRNRPNVLLFPTGPGNPRNPEINVRQPLPEPSNSNPNFNWVQRSYVLENGQSRGIEEQNFKQPINLQLDSKLGNTYSGKPAEIINDYNANINLPRNKNGDAFNRRVSVTLNDADMMNTKNFDEQVGAINSGYYGNSRMDYFNRKPKNSWTPNFYRPEKGVIINFNTECPVPRQFNNQLVHKFIFTPKSPLSAPPEVSAFPIPETAVISAHKMTPMYYI